MEEVMCVLSVHQLRGMINQIKKDRKDTWNGDATTGVFIMENDPEHKTVHYQGRMF